MSEPMNVSLPLLLPCSPDCTTVYDSMSVSSTKHYKSHVSDVYLVIMYDTQYQNICHACDLQCPQWHRPQHRGWLKW